MFTLMLKNKKDGALLGFLKVPRSAGFKELQQIRARHNCTIELVKLTRCGFREYKINFG